MTMPAARACDRTATFQRGNFNFWRHIDILAIDTILLFLAWHAVSEYKFLNILTSKKNTKADPGLSVPA